MRKKLFAFIALLFFTGSVAIACSGHYYVVNSGSFANDFINNCPSGSSVEITMVHTGARFTFILA